MIYHNVDFEKQEKEINCVFGDAIRELQVSRILKQSNIKGKSGRSFFDVFQFLLLLVFYWSHFSPFSSLFLLCPLNILPELLVRYAIGDPSRNVPLKTQE